VVVRKLEVTDAFYVLDFEDAARSVGIVRLAPKVLVDGAELLARATTYSYAAFGVNAGGVSAGINAKPEGRDDAVTAFCESVAALVGEGRLHFSPGTGLTADELAPLGCDPLDLGLTARGAVAAAATFGGAGDAVIVGDPSWQERVAPWWTDAGGTTALEGPLDADVTVLFLAGRSGFVDHDAAASIRARFVVPLTPVPVTAKAYAVLCRAGVVFVPDAVSCAAPLLAIADPEGEEPVSRVTAVAGEIAHRGVDAWRAMVERAEEHLASWRPTLPFGRPLA
jgi:glutamate dehydrogenase/leucine dehydrogenase